MLSLMAKMCRESVQTFKTAYFLNGMERLTLLLPFQAPEKVAFRQLSEPNLGYIGSNLPQKSYRLPASGPLEKAFHTVNVPVKENRL